MTKKNLTLFIIALLAVDQAVKIVVKTHMALGESITVFPNWFFIHFVENPGAAFGMQIGGATGKLLLSLFRIVFIGGLVWYIGRLMKRNAPRGVIVGFGLILAGAIGNMIDSAFYGVIFGYAPLLHGKVVDMLYFPLFTIGDFTFFSPVFNFADSFITVGLLYLLLFQRKFFSK